MVPAVITPAPPLPANTTDTDCVFIIQSYPLSPGGEPVWRVDDPWRGPGGQTWQLLPARGPREQPGSRLRSIHSWLGLRSSGRELTMVVLTLSASSGLKSIPYTFSTSYWESSCQDTGSTPWRARELFTQARGQPSIPMMGRPEVATFTSLRTSPPTPAIQDISATPSRSRRMAM